VEPGERPGEPGREKPLLDEREGPIWIGRDEVGALGRADGIALGRTPALEDPREELGASDDPPLEGRGAALEPREPWLEEECE
jgi:hypothetical protein